MGNDGQDLGYVHHAAKDTRTDLVLDRRLGGAVCLNRARTVRRGT